MKRFKSKRLKQNTMNKYLFIVFFSLFLTSLILFNIYASKVSQNALILVNEKLDTIIYEFFNELITDEIINTDTVADILQINKNKDDEILAVNYDLEKTYAILTKVANILTTGINDLEKGNIDVTYYDTYLRSNTSKRPGLVLDVPVFLNSSNIFLVNLGPRIPIFINFNEAILTNVKTKVTNYGLNNALLEIYLTVEMQKLIITPLKKDNTKFNYDILVSAVVVNGRVPMFYGDEILSASNILDIPLNNYL